MPDGTARHGLLVPQIFYGLERSPRIAAALRELIASHGLVVERSAVFGMQSNNPRLLDHSARWLTQHRTAAVRLYNWLLFPLGLLLQQRLKFTEGLMDLAGIHEVLLVCRRAAPAADAT